MGYNTQRMKHVQRSHSPVQSLVGTSWRVLQGFIQGRLLGSSRPALPSPATQRILIFTAWLLGLAVQIFVVWLLSETVSLAIGLFELWAFLAEQYVEETAP